MKKKRLCEGVEQFQGSSLYAQSIINATSTTTTYSTTSKLQEEAEEEEEEEAKRQACHDRVSTLRGEGAESIRELAVGTD